MSFRIWLFIFCGLLISKAALADDTALLIDKSRSPDGKLEIWIVPVIGQDVSSGTAQIREVPSGKVEGTFEWAGFGVQADEQAFAVLWRSDSRFFAISYELSRGYAGGAIYGRTDTGHWREVKLPDDDYLSTIGKMSGIEEWKSGKGYQTPEKWLASGDLELDVGSKDLVVKVAGDWTGLSYQVDLRVAGRSGNPISPAKIVSISQRTEAEAEKDLMPIWMRDQ